MTGMQPLSASLWAFHSAIVCVPVSLSVCFCLWADNVGTFACQLSECLQSQRHSQSLIGSLQHACKQLMSAVQQSVKSHTDSAYPHRNTIADILERWTQYDPRCQHI